MTFRPPATLIRTVAATLLLLTACRFKSDRELQPGDIRGRFVFKRADDTMVAAQNATVNLVGSKLKLKTDENGSFILRGMPAGSYSLKAAYQVSTDPNDLAGLSIPHVDLVESDGASADLGSMVVLRLAALDGVVTVDNQPAPAAKVVLADYGQQVTDAQGHYAYKQVYPILSTDPADQLRVVATSGDQTSGGYGEARYLPKMGESADVAVPIVTPLSQAAAATVTGTAALAGGGDVSAISVEALMDGSTEPISLNPNPDGRYILSALPAGTYTIRFTAPGYETIEFPATVVIGEPVQLPMVLLTKADATCGFASGVVVDTDKDGIGDPCDDEPTVPNQNSCVDITIPSASPQAPSLSLKSPAKSVDLKEGFDGPALDTERWTNDGPPTGASLTFESGEFVVRDNTPKTTDLGSAQLSLSAGGSNRATFTGDLTLALSFALGDSTELDNSRVILQLSNPNTPEGITVMIEQAGASGQLRLISTQHMESNIPSLTFMAGTLNSLQLSYTASKGTITLHLVDGTGTDHTLNEQVGQLSAYNFSLQADGQSNDTVQNAVVARLADLSTNLSIDVPETFELTASPFTMKDTTYDQLDENGAKGVLWFDDEFESLEGGGAQLLAYDGADAAIFVYLVSASVNGTVIHATIYSPHDQETIKAGTTDLGISLTFEKSFQIFTRHGDGTYALHLPDPC